MEKTARKISKFTDLHVWKYGHELVLLIYGYSQKFPANEQFGLTSQMRRAAVSVTSNIAEGFSRQTNADKVHFYTMAHGSLTELQNQLLIARDVKFLPETDFHTCLNKSIETHKLLTGLIKAVKGSTK